MLQIANSNGIASERFSIRRFDLFVLTMIFYDSLDIRCSLYSHIVVVDAGLNSWAAQAERLYILQYIVAYTYIHMYVSIIIKD